MVAKLLLVVSGLLMLFFVRPKLPKFVLYHTKIAHCQVRAAKVELRVGPELPKFLLVSRGAKVALCCVRVTKLFCRIRASKVDLYQAKVAKICHCCFFVRTALPKLLFARQ